MTEEKLPWANVNAAHSFARTPSSADALQELMNDYAQQ
jgi:hypothetical protein